MPESYEVEGGSQDPEAVAKVVITYEPKVKTQGPKRVPRSTEGDRYDNSVLEVGCLVDVKARSGPGENYEGGVGRITSVSLPLSAGGAPSYDISMVLGGFQQAVPAWAIQSSRLSENGCRLSRDRPSRQKKPSSRLEDTALITTKPGRKRVWQGNKEHALKVEPPSPPGPSGDAFQCFDTSRFVGKQIKDADRLLERLCREDCYELFGEEEEEESDKFPPPILSDGTFNMPLSIDSVRDLLSRGKYVVQGEEVERLKDPVKFALIQWDVLRSDLTSVIAPALDGNIADHRNACKNTVEEGERLLSIAREGLDRLEERAKLAVEAEVFKYLLRSIHRSNEEPCVQGEWRTQSYPPRVYNHYLKDYEPAQDIPEHVRREVIQELNTSLPDGYLGEAYSYDDHGISEAWMQELGLMDGGELGEVVFDSETGRRQVQGRLYKMVQQVVDRVLNMSGALNQPPLALGTDLVEVPVWGIDCYTYYNVLSLLSRSTCTVWGTTKCQEECKRKAREWIERKFLSCINCHALEAEQAGTRDITMDLVLNGMQSDSRASQTDRLAAAEVFKAFKVNRNMFHCHPKGTGVVCQRIGGIPADVFVNKYLGELYPAWRWSQKLGAVEATQTLYGIKPDLPDFYNILLERPRVCYRGYNILYCEAGRHVANFSSTLSHSCDPNCTTAVVVQGGHLCIALSTIKAVKYGEELTIDYSGVTTSETEFYKAVCLCGTSRCRGSFLRFSGAQGLDVVLHRFGPLMTFQNLLHATKQASCGLSEADSSLLEIHGFKSSALGDKCPVWLQCFVATQLAYIEFERRKLPIALMCMNSNELNGYSYTHDSADTEARSVMELRVQSLVTVLGIVRYVLGPLANDPLSSPPLVLLSDTKVIDTVWEGRNSIARNIVRRLEQVYERVARSNSAKTVNCGPENAASSTAVPDWSKEGVQKVTYMIETPHCNEPTTAQTAALNTTNDKEVECTGPIVGVNTIVIQPDTKSTTTAVPASSAPPLFKKVTGPSHHQFTSTGQQFSISEEEILRLEGSNSIKEDDRITLWDPLNSRQLAPKLKNLRSFLQSSPWMELYTQSSPLHLPQLPLIEDSCSSIPCVHTNMYHHKCSGRNNANNPKKRRMESRQPLGNIVSSNHPSSLPAPHELGLETTKVIIGEMKTLLSRKVQHRGQLRQNLLSLRSLIMSLPPLSAATGPPPCTPLVVADMLLLLAHTRNLISAHAYPKVVSPPVKVRAMDLGSRVPMSILKKFLKLATVSISSSPCSSDPSSSAPQISVSAPMRGNDRVAVVDIETGKILKGLKAPKRENLDSFLIANPHYCVASVKERKGTAASDKKKAASCEGDEVVNEVQIVYEPHFVLAQLLQWYNEGHSVQVNKTLGTGLVGCARIPDPSELCYSHKNWGKYTTETHRPLLLKHLEDVNHQRRPWPHELVEVLGWGGKMVNTTTLFGSPIMDAALNDPSGLKAVTDTLRHECGGSTIEEVGALDGKKTRKSLGGGKSKTVAANMDHDLPAGASAQPCNWVQCDNCLKWRRLPWFVNPSEDIKEHFLCKDNQWTPESASCDAEEDAWGSEEENGSRTTWNSSTDIHPKHLLKGIWIDVYCDKTCQWIPGKIIHVDLPGPSIRIHYFGWNKQFDETILCDSKRLADLHARSRRTVHSNNWLAHNRVVICMSVDQG